MPAPPTPSPGPSSPRSAPSSPTTAAPTAPASNPGSTPSAAAPAPCSSTSETAHRRRGRPTASTATPTACSIPTTQRTRSPRPHAMCMRCSQRPMATSERPFTAATTRAPTSPRSSHGPAPTRHIPRQTAPHPQPANCRRAHVPAPSEPLVAPTSANPNDAPSRAPTPCSPPGRWRADAPTEPIDARVLDNALWILRTYHLRVTAAREAGHNTHGDGTALDLVPAEPVDQAAWDASAGALAHDLGWNTGCGASGSRPVCPLVPAIQFVGYDGYRNHGSPRTCTGGCRVGCVSARRD